MIILEKLFCRIYQGAFKLAMPILPYKNPVIFTNVKECVPLFQKLNFLFTKAGESSRRTIVSDQFKTKEVLGIVVTNVTNHLRETVSAFAM